MATKKNKLYHDMEYYLNLPWKYTLEESHDNDGKKIYIVRVNELGAVTDSYTIDTAMKEIKEVMLSLFEMYIEAGDEIPEPIDESKFKGNIAYRTTPRRHYSIALEAEKKGLSLSQLIDSYIDTAQVVLKKK